MGQEIERKFLLADDSWREGVQGTTYRQGYLSSQTDRTVRVRTIQDRAFLTIKGRTEGVSRQEFEYEIPFDDALKLLNLCEQPIIEKQRFKIPYAGLIWEIDEFFGENEGLVVAEVELKHENETFEKPEWLGDEVTGDNKYYNSQLSIKPFNQWKN